jgi:biopolymer transport protein TolR
MARTFRRQRQAHPISELNVTNLIDLGFTLLIIFMITTSSSKQEQTIPVRLPLESKSQQIKPPADQKYVSVSVDGTGKFYYDTEQVSLADLRSRLEQLGSSLKKPVMRIRGDASVPYEKIVQLMDEIKKAGLTEFTFDTRTSG